MAKKQTSFWRRRFKRFHKRFKLLFVPAKENNYRPYLVRRIPLLIVVAAIASLLLGYNYSKTGSVLGRVSNVTVEGLIIHTNEQRKSNDTQALKENTRLNKAAGDKARDMFAKDYWDHNAPDGTEPWVWIDKSGYSYTLAGENLAKNFSTSAAVVAAWMNSPSHRDNLLNPDYQDIGLAVVEGKLQGEPTTLIVALYAKPANWKTASEARADTNPKQMIHQASANVQLTPAAKVGVAMQSLNPAALTSLILIVIALTVAITAHFFRQKLPPKRRNSWHRHHGWLKAAGLLAIAALVVLLYSGGQI